MKKNNILKFKDENPLLFYFAIILFIVIILGEIAYLVGKSYCKC